MKSPYELRIAIADLEEAIGIRFKAAAIGEYTDGALDEMIEDLEDLHFQLDQSEALLVA